MPAVDPVNVPLDEPIVATDVLLLLHTPAPDASVSVVDAPVQIALLAPVIDAGAGDTVTTIVVLQPDDTVKMIVDVPVPVPVTTPPLLTVAAAVLLLV